MMCESNAYVEEDGKEIPYLESIDIIRPEGSKIYLRNFMGEEKVFEGMLKEILLVEHRIVLKRNSDPGND